MLDLGAAAAAGGVVAWKVDLATGTIAWSEALETVLQVERAVCESQAGFSGLIHRDDFALVAQTVEDAIRTKSPFRTALRLTTGRGVRWVEVTGLVGPAPAP